MQPGKCSFIVSASVAQEDHWHQCWGSCPETQHVTSRKSSSLLWAELFFPSLLSMSPFSNNSPLIFLWRTTLPTCNPHGWVRLTPNPKSLGRLYVPVLGYMSHLPFLLGVSSLTWEYVMGCAIIPLETSGREGWAPAVCLGLLKHLPT